jgi:DNA-binding transcriptional LysR family regulator
MDAPNLRIVESVAQNGSMNRAAAELHTVRSNVTAHIRLFEDELGTPLSRSRSIRRSCPGAARVRAANAWREGRDALYEGTSRRAPNATAWPKSHPDWLGTAPSAYSSCRADYLSLISSMRLGT